MNNVTNYHPIIITLPYDGFHNGVFWGGLADNWKHSISARIVDGIFVTDQWSGVLLYSSLN